MKAEQRKEEIVKAAKVAFARKGYRSTSISDIVEQGKVGRGTFYLHFKSKQEIFVYIIESYFDGLVAILDQNHEAVVEALKKPRNIIRVWAESLYRVLVYHQQEPELSRIIYREALGMDADFSHRVQKLAAYVISKVSDELQMMLEKGLIRECDVAMTTSILYSSVAGVIIDFLVDPGKADIAHICNELMSHHSRALMPGGLDADAAMKNVAICPGQTGS
jgi:AcrR family transcriptional regulator